MRNSVHGLPLACLLASATWVQADQSDAKQILLAMSEYMAQETSFAFEYDATLDIITDAAQKLSLASSGKVQLARPNKLHATRVGGYSNVEIVFNGATFGALDKNLGVAAQQAFSGDIDALFDELRTKHAVPFPAADLLYSNAHQILMEEVVDIKDLGVGVIGGQVCDHLAFRTEEVDWQIWIAQGDEPHPCRFEIVNKALPLGPSYRIDLRNWDAGGDIDAEVFELKLGETVTLLDFIEFDAQAGHLPPHFTTGDRK